MLIELQKHNRGEKNLLLTVDCLSRNLMVEPLKTKFVAEPAQASTMIKHEQAEKVSTDDGTECLCACKALCIERRIDLFSTFSQNGSSKV